MRTVECSVGIRPRKIKADNWKALFLGLGTHACFERVNGTHGSHVQAPLAQWAKVCNAVDARGNTVRIGDLFPA
ncbi:hypothetical protein BCAR13_300049 [Paraburkholderia caribensis]|nr:hypothetical protein BCAR13_300049 [Paraburkholderia caribensis]